MPTKNKSRILQALLATAAFAASQPAAADTLKYGGAWLGSYDGGFTIQDDSPYRPAVTVLAGAFKMTDTTGSTLPAGTSFMALCVDIYHFLNTTGAGTSYSLTTGTSFYSGGNGYKATDLERLASYVFDNNLLTTAAQSAAFQLAAWEIVNDAAGTGNYNLGMGDFRVTTGDAVARTLAGTWLGVVNAGSYQIDQKLSVWAQDIAGSTQDLAVFAPIPEPESYAMLLAGLALMGFVARRRTQLADSKA